MKWRETEDGVLHFEHRARIRLRQQDVADVLRLSRESVSRVLTSPQMRRRLDLGRGSIVLIGV